MPLAIISVVLSFLVALTLVIMLYVLVMPKKGASLIRKTEKLRTFTPEQNQRADAYKFDYRLYYDLIVKNSMKDATYSYLY